jgi:transcriptional regulator with PAS, ATPase and Fis domain
VRRGWVTDFLSISLSGPSKKDKVDLEALSVMVDTFIMNVDLGGQIGILNKESEKNSVLYEERIAESNRLKKVFSRQPEILNALHQQAYILKRWGHVNNGFESVTPRERKEDKKGALPSLQ